ncbi:MAG: hypothetical protein KC731_29945, partial [Myxococcales bacterium]|nr:hypothetical protein [Myxococcales bacterium]
TAVRVQPVVRRKKIVPKGQRSSPHPPASHPPEASIPPRLSDAPRDSFSNEANLPPRTGVPPGATPIPVAPTSQPGGRGPLRTDPDAGHRGPQLAKIHFKKGKRLLFRGQNDRALVELDKAIELDPDNIECALFHAWTTLQLGNLGGPELAQREQQIELLATRALGVDKGCGFAHYVLGQLALRHGRNEDAYRALKRAVSLDGDNEDARRGFRIAERRAKKK